MIRVAGVASIICRNFKGPIETDEIISACLLHDMGNIIKFNLDALPELLEPEGKGYWSLIQKDFIARYGNDEHKATLAIAKEAEISDRVYNLIKSFGFGKACERAEDDDFPKKICNYSDQRVGPFGVLSLKERIREGSNRFIASGRKPPEDERSFEESVSCLGNLEKQVFDRCSLKPEDITDSLVETETKNIQAFWM